LARVDARADACVQPRGIGRGVREIEPDAAGPGCLEHQLRGRPELALEVAGVTAGLDPRRPPSLGSEGELMAEGRSNAGIAERLVITEGAVEKHVASILTKLDLPISESDNRRVLAVLRYLQS
jgi:hypothetical protein